MKANIAWLVFLLNDLDGESSPQIVFKEPNQIDYAFVKKILYIEVE